MEKSAPQLTNIKKDEETGEAMTRLNFETGEEEYIVLARQPSAKTKIFKIPSSYINKNEKEEKIKFDCSPTFTAAVLFLLPTTVFFYPTLGILLGAVEAYIHVWAHRKNKSLTNKNLYYQSPLHIIRKEFCEACREEESFIKISKFHEKRASRFKKYSLDYVRRIVT